MPEILRLYPPPAKRVDEVYGVLEFPVGDRRADASKPYVCINMVSSLDGRTTVDGKAGGIGGSTDREAMRILRSKVDAVMVGAGTLRAEKLSLTSEGRRSPEPLAVVVSSSGNLPLEKNLIGTEKDRALVIVPDSISREIRDNLSRRARVLVTPGGSPGRVELAESIRLLKQHFQVGRLLVEGGPSLNHTLISDGLVDELFLTLSPKIIGGFPGESQTLVNGDYLPDRKRSLRLLSAYLSGSELFLRYRLG